MEYQLFGFRKLTIGRFFHADKNMTFICIREGCCVFFDFEKKNVYSQFKM